jgi:hypothetical protein
MATSLFISFFKENAPRNSEDGSSGSLDGGAHSHAIVGALSLRQASSTFVLIGHRPWYRDVPRAAPPPRTLTAPELEQGEGGDLIHRWL